jgi:outer membrane protein OmpA-like peptidoglycan-associated protein
MRPLHPARHLLPSLAVMLIVLGACATQDDALQAPPRSAVLARAGIGQAEMPTPKTIADPDAARMVAVSPAPGDRAPSALGAAQGRLASSGTSDGEGGGDTTAISSAVPQVRGVEPNPVSIDFARGQDSPLTLPPAALQALAERGKRTSMIVVAGYARPGGDSNLELARRRAATVKGALVERGVDEARIRTVAAIAEVDTADATRVDIRFVGDERARR